jgi:hypothetical protein
MNEHSTDIRVHLPSFTSVKSTLYRHRQRNQTIKLVNTDCKSSSILTTRCSSLPPKKRPLTIDMNCLPTTDSLDNNHDEKRRKYSSSTSPYDILLAQNYMFMYVYASVLSSLQQMM